MNTALSTPMPSPRTACAGWLTCCLLATAAAFAAPQANAADRDIAGVKVAQSLKLAGKSLELNGVGLRYRGPFKVYAAALYTTRKVESTEDFHAETGAKRLEITMLREVDSTDMGRMFINGMLKNTSGSDQGKLLPDVARMGEIFATHKRLLPGEQVVIDWVPGQGMQITVRGKPQGQVFQSPEFFGALMNIWLGKSPADWQLKDALLGKSETERVAKL